MRTHYLHVGTFDPNDSSLVTITCACCLHRASKRHHSSSPDAGHDCVHVVFRALVPIGLPSWLPPFALQAHSLAIRSPGTAAPLAAGRRCSTSATHSSRAASSRVSPSTAATVSSSSISGTALVAAGAAPERAGAGACGDGGGSPRRVHVS